MNLNEIKKAVKKMNKELVSQCCGYYAQGEIDDDNTGRCSHCKEWTSFEIIND